MTTAAPNSSSLPAVLISPPWLAKQRAQAPSVSGLTPPSGIRLAWLPHERESWARAARPFMPSDGWGPTIKAVHDGTPRPRWAPFFAAFGPEQEVRALLPAWNPEFGPAQDLARVFVARFEAEALPAIEAAHATRRVLWSLPFNDPATAAFMCDAAVRLRGIRKQARAWLDRHPDYAARWLVPQFLGSVPVARQAAAAGLLRLAESSGADRVATAAEAYGPEAAAAVRDLLADKGLSQFPRVMPGVPAWAEPAALPEVALKGGGGEVAPPEAVRAIVQMLSISKPDAPYAGLAQVREACDAASLGSLSWTLFRSWQSAGSPAASRWAMESISLLADDQTVRDFAAEVATWNLSKTVAPALAGLDLIAAVGNRAALTTLYELSRRAKQRSVRDYAGEKLGECGESMGLSAEQLGDRVVSDLGVDAEGTLVLDFGPRRFTVSFDEQLEPRIADESGRVLKALPKPGVKDDEILARAAIARFSTLRKEARTLATEQIQRFEHALWTRRRWSPEEFHELLAAHPFLRLLVRRLVWAVFEGGDSAGRAIGTFRLAEDNSLADVRDDAYTPPPGSAIGVAHPVDLGADLDAWCEVLDDYAILQPFAQVRRPAFALTDAERAAHVLDRFAPGTIDPRRTVMLEQRGWRRGPSAAEIGWETMERPLAGDLSILIHLTPGMRFGHPAACERQSIDAVWIHRAGRQRWEAPEDAPLLGTLDAGFASELLRDLTDAADDAE